MKTILILFVMFFAVCSFAQDDVLTRNYKKEFKKMRIHPDYVPVFSDDTTGLPFAYPPNSVPLKVEQPQRHVVFLNHSSVSISYR